MDAEEGEASGREAGLRSVNSDLQTHVNFLNRTVSDVTSWWLDFNGRPVSYGDIGPGHVLPMTTYLTHPWVFRASRNGARLLVNGRDVYMPTATLHWNDHGHPVHLPVDITSPVYSLKDVCLMAVRELVKEDDYRLLDIPTALRHELRRPPDLMRDLQELTPHLTS